MTKNTSARHKNIAVTAMVSLVSFFLPWWESPRQGMISGWDRAIGSKAEPIIAFGSRGELIDIGREPTLLLLGVLAAAIGCMTFIVLVHKGYLASWIGDIGVGGMASGSLLILFTLLLTDQNPGLIQARLPLLFNVQFGIYLTFISNVCLLIAASHGLIVSRRGGQ